MYINLNVTFYFAHTFLYYGSKQVLSVSRRELITARSSFNSSPRKNIQKGKTTIIIKPKY